MSENLNARKRLKHVSGTLSPVVAPGKDVKIPPNTPEWSVLGAIAVIGIGKAGVVVVVKVESAEGLFAMKIYSSEKYWEREFKALRRCIKVKCKHLGEFYGLGVLPSAFPIPNCCSLPPILFHLLVACDPVSSLDRFPSLFASVEFVLTYWLSLFEALSALHSVGVSHGDVKPSNFLYDFRTRTCVLIDLSHSIEMDSGDLRVRGSIGYRACEVITETVADPRKSDIWSAGLTVLTLISRGEVSRTQSEIESVSLKSDSSYIYSFVSKLGLQEPLSASVVELLCHILCLYADSRPTAAEVVASVKDLISRIL